MTTSQFTDLTRVKAVSGQIWSPLGQDAVIMQLTTGKCYSLNTVGQRIWDLLQEPRTVQQLTDTILGEFDVAPDTCRRDLLALLGALVNAKLIEVEPPL